jgi:hypothetical protein
MIKNGRFQHKTELYCSVNAMTEQEHHDSFSSVALTGGMFSIAMTAPGVKYLNSNK